MDQDNVFGFGRHSVALPDVRFPYAPASLPRTKSATTPMIPMRLMAAQSCEPTELGRQLDAFLLKAKREELSQNARELKARNREEAGARERVISFIRLLKKPRASWRRGFCLLCAAKPVAEKGAPSFSHREKVAREARRMRGKRLTRGSNPSPDPAPPGHPLPKGEGTRARGYAFKRTTPAHPGASLPPRAAPKPRPAAAASAPASRAGASRSCPRRPLSCRRRAARGPSLMNVRAPCR